MPFDPISYILAKKGILAEKYHNELEEVKQLVKDLLEVKDLLDGVKDYEGRSL